MALVHFRVVEGRTAPSISTLAGRGGGRRHAGEGDYVERRQFAGVVKVHMLQRVAIFDAVLGAQILVLLVIVFMSFHDSNTRKAYLVERAMMSAAAEPIKAIDHHGVEIRDIVVRHLIDIAREISRWAINFAPGKSTGPGFFFGFNKARSFGKNGAQWNCR